MNLGVLEWGERKGMSWGVCWDVGKLSWDFWDVILVLFDIECIGLN